MVVNYGSDHISNWTCYVYNLASNSLDHVSNWKCVVLKSGHNFGQMSFFSGTLIRTDVAFGQMSLSDRSRVTLNQSVKIRVRNHLNNSCKSYRFDRNIEGESGSCRISSTATFILLRSPVNANFTNLMYSSHKRRFLF